jgi:hypothetical protein
MPNWHDHDQPGAPMRDSRSSEDMPQIQAFLQGSEGSYSTSTKEVQLFAFWGGIFIADT